MASPAWTRAGLRYLRHKYIRSIKVEVVQGEPLFRCHVMSRGDGDLALYLLSCTVWRAQSWVIVCEVVVALFGVISAFQLNVIHTSQ